MQRLMDIDLQIEFAYMAGLIDGEGCLGVQKTSPELSIGMTDEILVREIHTRYGGAFYTSTPKKETHLPVHHWKLTGYACGNLLRNVVPYMRIKKELAELVIAYYNTEFSYHDPRKGIAREAIRDHIRRGRSVGREYNG
jgi:hypothetical protein